MDTRNPRAVSHALPASWEGMGYLMDGDRADEARKGRDHLKPFVRRNFVDGRRSRIAPLADADPWTGRDRR
ncbi:hypothetical protein EVAR_31820_1 [Eumeta japonica]|uniref:Uncharacterized protein n=1 Tax=Eumeta variegata TaxID=151549 RepID=A0A4C1WI26_EUMVA|nr:hypothetical protein EVAR_31820_1 [Eumeta japonica]